ncbi:ATP-binding protein [Corynebacterium aquilae]|uniref:IstB-like ATP-binding domain-containing protein n=1 Tax=Corynebacterium aquilae DSM 44791 TaxID=1431546 RepID=A0A1L7CIK9_9CORY|nr:ATP-binding protein [Corynebacterium aquilae]APT85202.1 hypothetical protein CAQU_09095 [Corynebacterium aquilae DSM 44791]APT85649.1 hypothetical protein CAQU_12045 [Corynebacterium aquilae DSM 44791]
MTSPNTAFPAMSDDDYELFKQFRITAMGEAIRTLLEDPATAGLTGSQIIRYGLHSLKHHRDNVRLAKRRKAAHLDTSTACVENIHYDSNRDLDKATIDGLAQLDWVRHGTNVIVQAPCGVGKTYIVKALGLAACENGYDVRYYTHHGLIRAIEEVTDDTGAYYQLIDDLSTVDVLIIDDFALGSYADAHTRAIADVLDRRESSATVLASQLQPQDWYRAFDNPGFSEAILSRLLKPPIVVAINGTDRRRQ